MSGPRGADNTTTALTSNPYLREIEAMTKYRGIHPPRNSTLAEKLAWFSVPEPNSGCTLWIGATSAKDVPGGTHGVMRWDGFNQKAHRLAWIAERGPIPLGMNVLHTCDLPECVNTGHLFLGTQAANVTDKMVKGRHRPPQGERNGGGGKLTAAQVYEIRAATGTKTAIARAYGITDCMVGFIKRREAWKHLP